MEAQTCLQCLQVVCSDKLEDALAGTDLAEYAKRHKFGLYVFRGAMSWPWAGLVHKDLRSLLADIPVRSDGDKVRTFKAELIPDQHTLCSLTKWLHTASKMSLEIPCNYVRAQLHSRCEDAHLSLPCPRQPAWIRSTGPGILCYQPRHPNAVSKDSGYVAHRQVLT